MVRKVSVLALAVATSAAAGGCRHNCGGGWFTSRGRTEAPCQLAGSAPTCVEGVPVGGGFPAGVPGAVVPGPGLGSPAELPAPQPSDLIRPPGVPFAPPSAAPAPGESGANILPPPKYGVPVGGR